MAASNGRGGGENEEQTKKMDDLNRTLKEGERLLAPTRRPDGTLRKPTRIRAGYVPQEEVAIYQSKGALWKKEMTSLQDTPHGYTPPMTDTKPKTKSVKRNERKKEKRLQAAADKGTQPETLADEEVNEELLSAKSKSKGSATVESLASKINDLAVSSKSVTDSSQSVDVESSDVSAQSQDIDKKIRALKKKIRVAEAQLQKSTTSQDIKQEQLDKVKKLEGWHEELKLLEDSKSQMN